MNKQLFYSILLFIFFTNSHGYSQIIYTDVNPDITVSEFQQGYGVDFDSNGKTDFHITLLSNIDVWVMHLILDSSIDNTYVVYDGTEASVLEFGDEINSSSNLYHLGGSNWGGLLYGYWVSSGEYGNWTGTQEDKYLGIKFEIGNDFHYGWVHLSTIIHSHSDMEFTIKSFAYNSVPDDGISAGDIGTAGIHDSELSNISIYPNPTADFVNFKNINNLTKVIISDLTGKIFKNTPIDYLNNSINLSSLNNGVYLIQFNTNNGIISKKIIKQ